MEAQPYLALVYVLVAVINVVVSFLLWRSTRAMEYRSLMIAWLFGVAALVVAASSQGLGDFGRLCGFAVCFFLYAQLGSVFARMAGIPFRFKPYYLIMGGSLAAAWGVLSFGGGSLLLATFLVSTAVGLPAFVPAFLGLRRKWGELSLALRGFGIMVFIDGVHAIDYTYSVVDHSFIVMGFTLGVIFTVALTLFGPAAILERVAAEKARLETELAYKARLGHSAKLAALGEMAGGIAHEINTPLAIISTTAENVLYLVSEIKEKPPELQVFVKDLNDAVLRVAKIVKSLLVFSHGSGDGRLDSVSAGQVVEDTLVLCRESFKEKGIRLEVLGLERAPVVQCRPLEISQVLVNLLNNAKDAALGAPEKWVRVEVAAAGRGGAEISVSDSGPGIREEIREKIFQPFFTTKDVGQGTGLGLSVSKSIVESQGGTLTLDAKARATRFVVRLPS